MRRLTIVLVLAAICVLTASASADSWRVEKQPIPDGQTVEVSLLGAWNLELRTDRDRQIAKPDCSTTGTLRLENLAEEALAETMDIAITCERHTACGAMTVRAIEPWLSTLTGNGQPFTFETSLGMEVTCAGISTVYMGKLIPQVGDDDCPFKDDVDNHLKFRDIAKDGALPSTEGTGATLSITGGTVIGVNGQDAIDGDVPAGTCIGGKEAAPDADGDGGGLE